MDFKKHADDFLSQFDCQVCDGPVQASDAVFFDVDGDDERVRVRVWHAWCHTAVKDAVDKAKIELLEEIGKIARYNTAEDVVVACETRAVQLRRKLDGESGARVVEALCGHQVN